MLHSCATRYRYRIVQSDYNQVNKSQMLRNRSTWKNAGMIINPPKKEEIFLTSG